MRLYGFSFSALAVLLSPENRHREVSKLPFQHRLKASWKPNWPLSGTCGGHSSRAFTRINLDAEGSWMYDSMLVLQSLATSAFMTMSEMAFCYFYYWEFDEFDHGLLSRQSGSSFRCTGRFAFRYDPCAGKVTGAESHCDPTPPACMHSANVRTPFKTQTEKLNPAYVALHLRWRALKVALIAVQFRL